MRLWGIKAQSVHYIKKLANCEVHCIWWLMQHINFTLRWSNEDYETEMDSDWPAGWSSPGWAAGTPGSWNQTDHLRQVAEARPAGGSVWFW